MELNPSFFCNFKFKFDAKNLWIRLVKFMFSKKATKIEGIFTVYLTLCSKCQIDGEDLVNFCGLLKTRTLTNYIFGIKFGKKREISTGLSTYTVNVNM